MNFFSTPLSNQAEVTVIGTGGYGETILVKLANNDWIIIDSCKVPGKKTLPSLEYLTKIGVTIETDVKLIICTHWHNDHIIGLSKILEKCLSAKLSFAKATDKDKFLRFICFDSEKDKIVPQNSSYSEFNKCLEIIADRGETVISAIENKCLYNQFLGGATNCEVYSIAPSDYTMQKFDHEIGELITEYGSPSKKIPRNSANAKSVAVFLKLGIHRVILGGDLENASDPKEGWINILKNSTVIDKKSTLFKIPHHGSENGFNDEVWSKLLDQNCIGKITPWNKNNGLPEVEMLYKYCSLSDNVYMTKSSISSKQKARDKQIEKMVERLNIKLKEVKCKLGIIQSRITLDDPSDRWAIALLDNALHVNQLLKLD